MTRRRILRTITINLAAVTVVAGACQKRETEREPERTADAGARAEARRDTATRRTQPTPATASELATKYSACMGYINSSRWDQFKADCVTPTFVEHEVDGRDISGVDAMIRMLKDMKTAMPDWRLAPQLVIASNRNIFAIVMSTGTQTGPLKLPGSSEIAATNKKVGELFFHRLVFDTENKATEEWGYFDPRVLLGQIGQLKGQQFAATRPVAVRGLPGAPIVAITADDARERTNLATTMTHFELFNSRLLDDLPKTLTDTAVESDQSMAADIKGKQKIVDAKRSLLAGFSDGHVDVPDRFAAGDYVVALGQFTGTNDGKWNNLPKTGKKVDIEFAQVMRFENGKIAQIWRFRNGFALAEQLGLTGQQPR
jgi:predicted ester cyclase